METERKYVNLVITGNPGVGKHTTAELILKQNSSYEMIDINKFAIDEGFAEKLENGFEIDTTKLKDEIKNTIENYEPRVEIEEIIVDPNFENNEFNVTIQYYIVGIDVPEQELSFVLESTR